MGAMVGASLPLGIPTVRSPYAALTAAGPVATGLLDLFTPMPAEACEVQTRSRAARLGIAAALLIPLVGVGAIAVHFMPPAPDSISTNLAQPGVTNDEVHAVGDAQALSSAQSLIRGARQSIRLQTDALHGDAGQAIVQSLVDRVGHVKTIQVIADRADPRCVDLLRKNGIELRFSDTAAHAQMLLVDLNTVQTGSLGAAHDVRLVVQGPAAEHFHGRWKTAWGTPDDEAPLPPSEAPQVNARLRVLDGAASRSRMLDLIRHAHRSIRIETRGLKDYTVIQALKDAQNRGVAVNVLLDRGSLGAGLAFSDDTEPLPMRWYDGELGTRMAIFDESDVLMGSGDAVDVEMDSPTVVEGLNLGYFSDWQEHAAYAPVVPPAGWRQGTAVPR